MSVRAVLEAPATPLGAMPASARYSATTTFEAALKNSGTYGSGPAEE